MKHRHYPIDNPTRTATICSKCDKAGESAYLKARRTRMAHTTLDIAQHMQEIAGLVENGLPGYDTTEMRDCATSLEAVAGQLQQWNKQRETSSKGLYDTGSGREESEA